MLKRLPAGDRGSLTGSLNGYIKISSVSYRLL